MKLALFIALMTASLSTFAASVGQSVDLSEAECTQKCYVQSYSFSADFLGQCRQVESCEVYAWDEENAQCLVEAKNVLRTYPIQCRDIPPAY